MKKVVTMLLGVIAMIAPQLKKADSVVGITETMEAIRGVMAIAVFFCKKLKDGVQFSDFTEFYTKITADEEFKALMEKAWEGRKAIPAEIKDTDVGEGLELTACMIEYAPEIVDTFSSENETEAVL